MVSENVNKVRWHVVIPRFFLEKQHNLLCFCVHFMKNFANHAPSEMILLRRELGRMLVVEYRSICAFHPLPPQINMKKLNKLVFIKDKIKIKIFYFRSQRPIDRTCVTVVKI